MFLQSGHFLSFPLSLGESLNKSLTPRKIANFNLYTIFVYIPAPPVHSESLPISRIPMAVQFLTSGPCSMLVLGHVSNALQCFAVKMTVYYMLYLAAIQSAVPSEGLFPVASVTPIVFPPALLLSLKQEDFQTSSKSSSLWF